MATASKQSSWRDDFLFLGNELVLDFLNTRPVQDGKLLERLPDLKALLRWFQAAELLSRQEFTRLAALSTETAESKRTLDSFRQLRERLRGQVLQWQSGGGIDRSTTEELNRLLSKHPMRTKLTNRKGALATESWFTVHELEDLFAPLAQSAAKLFAEADPARVRKCNGCVLHFLDTSKKGTRRWCSMELCGNRLKVAAYALRRRSRAKSHLRHGQTGPRKRQ